MACNIPYVHRKAFLTSLWCLFWAWLWGLPCDLFTDVLQLLGLFVGKLCFKIISKRRDLPVFHMPFIENQTNVPNVIRKVLKFEVHLRCWTPLVSAKTPTLAPHPTGPASSFASGSSMCLLRVVKCCVEDEFPLEKGWFLGSMFNFRGVFLKVMILFAKMCGSRNPGEVAPFIAPKKRMLRDWIHTPNSILSSGTATAIVGRIPR